MSLRIGKPFFSLFFLLGTIPTMQAAQQPNQPFSWRLKTIATFSSNCPGPNGWQMPGAQPVHPMYMPAAEHLHPSQMPAAVHLPPWLMPAARYLPPWHLPPAAGPFHTSQIEHYGIPFFQQVAEEEGREGDGEEDVNNIDSTTPEQNQITSDRPKVKRLRNLSSGSGAKSGTERLRINFVSAGVLGEIPQRYGKSSPSSEREWRRFVPDKAIGRFKARGRLWWQFETHHRVTEDGKVRIEWVIRHIDAEETLETGVCVKRIETAEEARRRESSGHTICSQVSTEAFRRVSAVFRARIKEEKDKGELADFETIKILEDYIRRLGTKNPTSTLYFGLEYHQDRWHSEFQERFGDEVL